MEIETDQRGRLHDLSSRVKSHFEAIEQDVPDQSYLVGGAVRDALLGIEPNDYDFVVIGETEATMEARGFEPVDASSFPVFHDSAGEEWALARTEEKSGDGYKGFDVETENVSLKDDLNRRDLTLNAMCLDVRNDLDAYQCSADYDVAGDGWGLIDPYGGQESIEDGILRHVSDAFAEDPLRVIRTARYAARFAVPTDEDAVEYDRGDGAGDDEYHRFAVRQGSTVHAGMQVDSDTMRLMRRVAPELNRMSVDRIGTEIVKAMEQARRPSRFWEVLRDSGALAVIFPELDLAEIVPAGPEEYHFEGSSFDHEMMVVDRMHELCNEQAIDGDGRVRRLLMAVMHDIGKPIIGRRKGGLHSDDPPVRFGGHAEVGAKRISTIVDRLGLTQYEAVCADAAHEHMDVHDLPVMGPRRTIEFVSDRLDDAHGASIYELVDLAHADHEGRLQVEYRDPIEGTDQERVAFDTPEFSRGTFDHVVSAVERAVDQFDGYRAMRDHTCGEHEDVADEDLHDAVTSCDVCRSPGSWVGEYIESKQAEALVDELDA
jgi:tRNA nucleotidyltransferase (CCA-adding enzyme)